MLLEVEEAEKSFGGIHALNKCSLEVEEKSITGLIGPNGAGKTTLFKCITGFYKLNNGEIRFRSERISGNPPHKIAMKGVAKTFQISRELERMTVLENLLLGPKGQRGENILYSMFRPGIVHSQEIKNRQKAFETLDFFGLTRLRNEYAGNLSVGQKKLLELARIMMVDPDLILLDEPTAHVNQVLVDKLMNHIRELRKKGKTFLIIEHDMKVIMNLSDIIYVMNNGKIIAKGKPLDIQRDKKVVDAYLGLE